MPGSRARACRRDDPALGFEPRVRFDGPVDSIVGSDLAEHLIAALRELLSNVIRHARRPPSRFASAPASSDTHRRG